MLDLLHKVKYEQDGTLTFRRSCGHGICGSDAMLINGRNRLACKIRVDQLGKRKITVAPLPGLPVVKDLVVDMEGFFDQVPERQAVPHQRRARPGARAAPVAADRGPLRRHDQVHPVRRLHDVLPVVLGRAESYVGPAAIVNAHRFIFDSRDEAADERLEILADEDGVWRCRTIFNCVDACPRGINITQAILEVSRRSWTARVADCAQPAEAVLSESLWPDEPESTGADEAACRRRGRRPTAADGDRRPSAVHRPHRRRRPRQSRPGVARRGADRRRRRPDARHPDAAPVRLDLRVPRRPDQQRGRVHRASSARSTLARELGAREVELLLDSKLIVEQLARPLAGQGRQAHPALGRGAADARRLRSLERHSRPAGPEQRRRRAVQRGDRPGPGRWSGLGRPVARPAAGGATGSRGRRTAGVDIEAVSEAVGWSRVATGRPVAT